MDSKTPTDDLSARAAAILARLEEIDAACKAATDLPWMIGGRPPEVSIGYMVDPGCGGPEPEPEAWDKLIEIAPDDGSGRPCDPNAMALAQFILCSRTALPVLVRIGIAEVERAQGLLHSYSQMTILGQGLWLLDEAKALLDRWFPILEAGAENR